MSINSGNAATVVDANALRMRGSESIGRASQQTAAQVSGGIGQVHDALALKALKNLAKEHGIDPEAITDLQSAKDVALQIHSKRQAGAVQGAMAEPSADNPLSPSFEPPASALPSSLPASPAPSGAGGFGGMPLPDLGQAPPPSPAAAPSMSMGADASPPAADDGIRLPDAAPTSSKPAFDPTNPGASSAAPGMGGAPTPAAPSPAMLPPTGPLAPSGSADSRRSAYWRRIAKTSGLDMEGLGAATNLAHSMFGAPTAPESETEIELKRAQAAKAKRDSERPFDIDPLSPAGVAAQKEVAGATHPVRERNIDPLSPEGIEAERARRKAQLEADKEMGGGDFKPKSDEPKGEDQLLDPSIVGPLEKKAGLPPGALKGLSYRAWNAMKQDPQEEIIKNLRIIAEKDSQADRVPTSPAERFVKSLDAADKEQYDALVARAQPGKVFVGTPDKPDAEAVAELNAFVAAKTKEKGLDAAPAAPTGGGGPAATPDAPTAEEQSLIDGNPQMKAAWASYTTPEARAAALASLRKKRAAAGK